MVPTRLKKLYFYSAVAGEHSFSLQICEVAYIPSEAQFNIRVGENQPVLIAESLVQQCTPSTWQTVLSAVFCGNEKVL